MHANCQQTTDQSLLSQIWSYMIEKEYFAMCILYVFISLWYQKQHCGICISGIVAQRYM